jgi:alpha-galactosidase
VPCPPRRYWPYSTTLVGSGAARANKSFILSSLTAKLDEMASSIDRGLHYLLLSAEIALIAIALLPGCARKREAWFYPAQDPHTIIRPPTPTPSINGPRVVGSSPGKPFLFLIPATGQAPLTYAADNLPADLVLDPATGIISGAIAAQGATVARLTVSSPAGRTSRNLVIVGKANELALTPPMGWNSWYVWGLHVSDARMRAAAAGLISTGLAAHGYQYVNIDDGWEKGQAQSVKTLFGSHWENGPLGNGRDSNGEILTNQKFPDMTALGNTIHDRGLKFGIYSSPGPWTCGGYQGSHGHEQQDAQTYANWGVDFFKYDWCSYTEVASGTRLGDFQRPYLNMGHYVHATRRDMVFSLCQYGTKDVWEWGAAVGGNLWRTHEDLQDNWKRISEIGFDLARMAPFAGPGHWNDPDMIMVGMLGMGPNLHPTGLNLEEQITQVSLWSLVAAPLLISCDLDRMDPLTLALLSNDEVIAVDQDPLGKAATPRFKNGRLEVWARPLWDATVAAGLFNRGEKTALVTATWSALGIEGRQPVRDLWRAKVLGEFQESFSAEVPPHGTVLLKIGQPADADYRPRE